MTDHCLPIQSEEPLYLLVGEVGSPAQVLHYLLLLLLDRGGGAPFGHPAGPDRPRDWRQRRVWTDQNNSGGKTYNVLKTDSIFHK